MIPTRKLQEKEKQLKLIKKDTKYFESKVNTHIIVSFTYHSGYTSIPYIENEVFSILYNSIILVNLA